MCGRYTIGKSRRELETRFKAEMLQHFEPRFNLAPTQLAPVITSDSQKGFSHFYWGTTPEFAKNKPVSEKLINARAETVAEKAAYKGSFKRKRCLIPADGFYEWKTIGKKTRVPYRFTLLDDSLFAFAGLWDEYENEKGEINHTFLILTTSPNPQVAQVGDCMPVILTPQNEKKWLDKNTSQEDLLQMLNPYQEDQMISYTVSPLVNQVTNDSSSLIRKTSPMDQFGNYTLFG
ncbi:MAG: SOS response-associated peptidase [Anditalea sp.]